jgi:hypothetical protein
MFAGFTFSDVFCGCARPVGIFFFGGISGVERSTVAQASAWERACSWRELDRWAGEWEGKEKKIGESGEIWV